MMKRLPFLIALAAISAPVIAALELPRTLNTIVEADGIAPTNTGTAFPQMATGVGDLNGDGFEDLVMSQRNFPGGPAAISIAFGEANPSQSSIDVRVAQRRGVRIVCDTGLLVRRLEPAGDINGDGFADFLAGSQDTNTTALIYGGVWMNVGGNVNLSTLGSNEVLTMTSGGNTSGFAFGGLGDVNGDGYGDFAVNHGAIAFSTSPQIVNNSVAESAWTVENGGTDAIEWNSTRAMLVLEPNRGGIRMLQRIPLPKDRLVVRLDASARVDVNVGGNSAQCFLRIYGEDASGVRTLLASQTVPPAAAAGSIVTLQSPPPIPQTIVTLVYAIEGASVSAAADIAFNNFRFSYEFCPQSVDTGTLAIVYGSPSPLGTGGALDLRTIGVNDAGRRGTSFHHGGVYTNSSGGQNFGIGDFDGDGLDDIAIGGLSTCVAGQATVIYGALRDNTTGVGIGRNGVLRLSELTQTVDGVEYRYGISVRLSNFANTSTRTIGDLNGDGRADFLGVPTNTSTIRSVYSTAGRPREIGTTSTFPAGNSTTVSSVLFNEVFMPRPAGDFDRDGLMDLGLMARINGGQGPSNTLLAPATRLNLVTATPITMNDASFLYFIGGGQDNTFLQTAGDFNRDGRPDLVVSAGPLFSGAGWVTGHASVRLGDSAGPASSTYRNWIRHGDGGNPSGALPILLRVPTRPVGVVGGNPGLVPASQMAIGFRGGDDAPGALAASQQTVSLFRSAPPKPFSYTRNGVLTPFKSARKYWRMQTTRVNFDQANLTFYYGDSELAGFTPAEINRLGVFYSATDPAAAGFDPTKWAPLQTSGFDPARKTITVRREFVLNEANPSAGRDQLNGYYALFSGDVLYALGEEIVPSSAVNISKLPTTGPLVEPLGATFWHQGAKKLFAVQPFSAITIRWIDAANPALAPMETTVATTTWPGTPTNPGDNAPFFDRYVIGTPAVPLTGKDEASGDTVQSIRMLMTETDASPSQVEANKSFAASTSGRSLLLLSTGTNPTVDPIFFQFVWSFPFSESSVGNSFPVNVGTDIGKWGAESDGIHDLAAGEPFFMGTEGFYNPVFYDRSAAPKTGPLIPVNTLVTDSTEDDFNVVFYQASRTATNPLTGGFPTLKIYWPSDPMRLTVEWPSVADSPDPIVIASQLGSGPLTPTTYKSPSIYVQNQRTLPGPDGEDGTADDLTLLGYNPNEEHAVLIDQGNGPAAFALRNDLGTASTSQPFVLVSYLDGGNKDRPAMKVLRVVRQDATSDFVYDSPKAKVGDRVEAPFPLRSALFPTCSPSAPDALDGNYTITKELILQDRTGAFWVISADGAASVTMRYFYALREDFFLPEEYVTALRATDIYEDDAEFPTGTCVPWLDDWKNPAKAGTPVDVSFAVEWPNDAPTLFAAETLVEPKRGLPGIAGADSVEVAYDQSRVLGGGKSVDLIDPTRDRFVSFRFPSDDDRNAFLAEVRTVRRNGLLEFEEIVPHIRRRLLWDDNADRLIFRGSYVGFITGEDMLLPNVMTLREKAQIEELSDAPVFRAAVASLFTESEQIKLTQPTCFVLQTVSDTTLTSPTGVAAGDADRDGDEDLFVVSGGSLTVYLNRSETGDDWSSIAAAGVSLPGNVTHIVATDPDGDGDSDLFVATSSTGRNLFHIITPANLSGTWAQQRIVGTNLSNVTALLATDINVDGRADALVASAEGVRWFRFPGNTQETWEFHWVRQGLVASGLHTASFDGTGIPEIVIGHATSGRVEVLRNTSTATSFETAWAATLITATDALRPSGFATGDFNLDGFLDIATASTGNGRVLLHLNDGNTGKDAGFTTSRVADGFTGVQSIAAADIDEDGDHDLVAAASSSGRLQWFESNGLAPTNFYSNFITAALPGLSGIRLTDLDLDGSLDIVGSIFDGSGALPNSVQGSGWLASDGAARDVFDSLALTSAVAQGEGFVTLVYNNADFSTGAVTVEVIRVACPFHTGDVKVIYPDCPFNERVALRHNGDFAGKADQYEFRWRYTPAPTYLQILAETGAPPSGDDLTVWTDYANDGPGAVDIAVQDPSGELILSDLFWIVSYRPVPDYDTICGNATYTAWTGAGLTEGWVKRVIGDFGPFRQRATGGGIQGAEDNFVDYTNRTVNTIVSMISQAGERWEGNVPLSCRNVDELGLIETYQSVLNRAKALSIEAAPRRDLDQFIEVFDGQGNLISRTAGKDGVPDAGASVGVSNALLLAAARIADLYMLVGNEAFADASDPTIAFGTDDGVFGPVATSIHPFMNQTATLLEEELKLLRGRDASSLPSVTVRPFYNRLIWNFTNDFTGGEVAYVLNYGIGDVNSDSVIDEVDAAQLFPQAHGDAWGHQLTALKAYYALITEPEFAWVPRTEPVLVGGQAVEVDYYDERKFATAAAGLARSGREVVGLTYRDAYTENPSEQFLGYKDSNEERAWGLSEWGSRAGMGSYLNWVAANALIPDDKGTVPVSSIRKVDRNTVGELEEIAAIALDIQRTVDDADAGLNPLGIATNTVPFDISPSQLTESRNPRTHFEQVYDRAKVALLNAKSTFDFAASATIALRKQADNVADFRLAVDDQEFDYTNRLIEIFGTPYPDDIGPGQTYKQGYTGPDLIHWAYFDPSQLAEQEIVEFEVREVSGYFNKDLNFVEILDEVDFDFTDDELSDIEPAYGDNKDIVESLGETVEFTFHISEKYGQTKPANWTTQRRVYGDIQLAQLELFQAVTEFRKAVDNYDGFIIELESKLDQLELQYNVRRSQLSVRRTAQDNAIAMDTLIFASKVAAKAFGQTKEVATDFAKMTKDSVPDVVGLANDIGAPVTAVIQLASTTTNAVLEALEIASELTGEGLETVKDQVDRQAELSVEVSTAVEEVKLAVADIQSHLLNDTTLRFEMLLAEQEIQQKAAAWTQVLAEGQRLLEERARYRRQVAGRTQSYRYKDMAFRIFRNEAVQKYRAALDLAARYVYLTAKAYDYETNLLSGDGRGAGDVFLTDVVKARTLGVITDDGTPQTGQINGDSGLADPMARMSQNWEFALKGQLGFNNPQTETNRFSLRRELFRIGLEEEAELVPGLGDTNAKWREILSRPYGANSSGIIRNVLELPEFRRYCVPFSSTPENPLLAAEPAIVIRFGTNINFAQNFFVNADTGQALPLGAGDSSYDTTAFATKIRSVGVWMADYNALVGGGMSNTPRVYLVPTGRDLMRASNGNRSAVRAFDVLEQAIPVPFPLGGAALDAPNWSPTLDTITEGFVSLRRFSSFRAYHTSGGFETGEPNTNELNFDSRLIGRSVWNTEWFLIIPGGTLHSDRDEGIRRFIWGRLGTASNGSVVLDDQGAQRDGNGVSDIRLFFQTYAYTGTN